eukprot:TRINITY_DN14739_c0_g1_i1.p4 TRINITY_DN14739_c0_g1~~TRINITY_DN14739_c0_g1_i1.p4  ORF type:complete len:50 (+),score=8.02 TRINITY_DN14739_c0_g1_i1:390-539(+)
MLSNFCKRNFAYSAKQCHPNTDVLILVSLKFPEKYKCGEIIAINVEYQS